MAIAVRLAAQLGMGLLLTACSASVNVGTPSIDTDTLQSEVRSQLSKSVGQQAPPVSCPESLAAKVDASTTCTITDSSGTYDVAVKVTSVENGTASFDIQVADQPNP